MSARNLRLLAVVLAFGVLVGGCAPDPRVAQVQRVVRDYNTRLARGFADLDMNALSGVATRNQAQTEYYQMAALGEAKRRMLTTLKSLEFGEVSFATSTTADVATTEVWDYRQVSTETSQVVRSETGVRYRLSYRLVLQDGLWLVDSVKSVDATGTGGTP